MRLPIDYYFLNITQVVASRSTCIRHPVGAVIVKDTQILSTGYNGAPKGFLHCTDIGCIREQEKIASGTLQEICRAVHAEQNAIIQASNHGVSIKHATLYCTHQPCFICARMIINAGIEKVVYHNPYPDKRALEFFQEAEIECIQI